LAGGEFLICQLQTHVAGFGGRGAHGAFPAVVVGLVDKRLKNIQLTLEIQLAPLLAVLVFQDAICSLT
jgi:hypothetical protein